MPYYRSTPSRPRPGPPPYRPLSPSRRAPWGHRRVWLGQAEPEATPAGPPPAAPMVPTWVWIAGAGAAALLLILLLTPRRGAYGLRPTSGIIRLYRPRR